MTTRVYLWKGAQLGSMLVLNLAIARVLGAPTSGNFLFQVSNLQLLALLAGASVDSGIQYQSASEPQLASGLSRFILQYSTIILFPLAGLVAVALHWLRPGMDAIPFLILASVYMAGIILFKTFSALAFGLRSAEAPILLEGAGNVLLLPLLLATPAIFYTGYYLMPVVTGVILYAYLTRTRQLLFQQKSTPDYRRLFQYTGVSFMANMAWLLVYRTDYWWVAAWCTDKELGNYIQVSKLGQLFFYFPQLLSVLIFPDVVQAPDPRPMIKKLIGYVTAIYAACLVLFAALGRPILHWLLGPGFEAVYPTFLLLIPDVFALGGLAILSTFFAGRNRLGVNLKGALLGLGVMVLGDWIFIPQYHIAAAALVSSAAYMTTFVYSYLNFRRAAPTTP